MKKDAYKDILENFENTRGYVKFALGGEFFDQMEEMIEDLNEVNTGNWTFYDLKEMEMRIKYFMNRLNDAIGNEEKKAIERLKKAKEDLIITGGKRQAEYLVDQMMVFNLDHFRYRQMLKEIVNARVLESIYLKLIKETDSIIKNNSKNDV